MLLSFKYLKFLYFWGFRRKYVRSILKVHSKSLMFSFCSHFLCFCFHFPWYSCNFLKLFLGCFCTLLSKTCPDKKIGGMLGPVNFIVFTPRTINKIDLFLQSIPPSFLVNLKFKKAIVLFIFFAVKSRDKAGIRRKEEQVMQVTDHSTLLHHNARHQPFKLPVISH